MRHNELARVLALDLHPRRFGYVVLESPDRLLDWGVCSDRRKRHSGDVLIRKRLRRMLESWNPSVIVIYNPTLRAQRSTPRRDRILKRLGTEANERRIPIYALKADDVGITRKRLTHHENARRVAEHFSSLKWKLPPKRKAWESEHYRTSIFTAAALAMWHSRISS